MWQATELVNIGKCGIYAITNTSKAFVYIGMTRDSFLARWLTHIELLNCGAHSNRALQCDWANQGAGAFAFSIVEIVSRNTSQRGIELIEQRAIAVHAKLGGIYNTKVFYVRPADAAPVTPLSVEHINAATIASEAGVPRSTVAKWIASGRLVAAQESKRGKYFTRLFRRIDAQPLIEKARERKAQEAAEAENV